MKSSSSNDQVRTPIKTEGVKAIIKLSAASIECSSYIAIRATRGNGKTMAYSALSVEWTNDKSAPAAYYFRCMPDGTGYGFFRELVQHLINRRFEPREHPSLRELIELVRTALAANRSNFLFLDDIEHLDAPAWNMVRLMFETIRAQGIKFGMAVTDSLVHPQFRDGRWDPSLLETVHLRPCDRDYMIAVLVDWEPRLKRLFKAYYKGDEKVIELAEIMHQRTRGNLRAMDSLALTLSSTLRSRPASEKDIRRCLALRSTDRDPLQLQFQLSA
jgi:hypothetical protein